MPLSMLALAVILSIPMSLVPAVSFFFSIVMSMSVRAVMVSMPVLLAFFPTVVAMSVTAMFLRLASLATLSQLPLEVFQAHVAEPAAIELLAAEKCWLKKGCGGAFHMQTFLLHTLPTSHL